MPVIAIGRPNPNRKTALTQCQHPSGWIGRLVLGSMNRRHSKLTDWGLAHMTIREGDTILDLGCGGGRTVAKLAAASNAGIVHGIDHSAASVAAAARANVHLARLQRVLIEQASVDDLPFADDTFDLITAVETHFWWRDLGAGLREALRVLKAGGHMVVIAEFYNGGKHARHVARLAQYTTMAMLDVEQHRAMLAEPGFVDVVIDEDAERGWICCMAAKPA